MINYIKQRGGGGGGEGGHCFAPEPFSVAADVSSTTTKRREVGKISFAFSL
jgi:hypothetical protein